MRNGEDFFGEHPMFILDHQTHDILEVNEQAADFYGYTRDALVGKKLEDLHEPDSFDTADRVDGNASVDEKIWFHRRGDGTKVRVQFTSHLFNRMGKPARLMVVHDVTRLLAGDEHRFEKLPRIKSYLANSPLAEIEWDRNYVVKEWSQRAEQFFGWKKEEVLGDEWFFESFIHPDEREIALLKRQDAIDKEKVNYTVEGRNLTKEGKVLYCKWYNSILYDKEGKLVSIYSLVHDVSKRRQSEILFRALSEESLVGVYLIQDNVFKYVNPRFANIFHYTVEEIQGRLGPLDLAHPEDRKTVDQNLEKRFNGEIKAMEYDFRCVTKDDQVIHVSVYGTRINYLGNPAVIGTLVDTTDRKLSLEQFRESVESFEDLFDSISDAIHIMNKNGKFIEVNQGAVDMYGYSREELIGKTMEFLAAPGKVDLEETQDKFNKALEGEKQVLNWWARRKNGEVFPKEVVLNPGTYFGEDVVIGIGRDTTERFEAEELLKRNEEMFRQLFQNAPIGIALMDHHQEIRLVNNAFEEIFGYSSEELRGLDIDRVIVPVDMLNEALDLSKSVFGGNVSEMISQRERKDGSLVDVLIYGVPVIINGKTIAIFGIYVDITERRRAEERIRRSLKEKEVLLAEIHHRVKNNLAVITGLLELQAYNTTSAEATEILKESQIRINSIALIHEKLYQSENLSQISFDVYIKQLVEIIVRALIKDDREIEVEFETEPVDLTINQAIPCGLILNELVTNCYKHAFNGVDNGRIQIGLREDGDQIVLRVEDNGVGLPRNLDIESPKSLGITLIRTLSKQLRGSYRFESIEPGTAFDLHFSQDD